MGRVVLVALVLLAAPRAAADEKATDPKLRAEIHAVLVRLQEAANAKDRARVAGLFHTASLVAELERQGFFERVPAEQHVRLRDAFRKRLQPAFAARDLVDPFVSFSLRRVTRIDETNRIVAYVRTQDADGWTIKMYWYLVKRADGWWLYDFADIDSGIRASSLFGAVLVELTAGGVMDVRGWAQAAHMLPEAFAVLEEGDLPRARKLAEKLESLGLPDALASVIQMILAMIDDAEGDTTKGLKRLDEAARLNPDAPGVNYVRATILNDAARYEEALRAAQVYVAEVDGDVQVNVEIARALIGLKRPAEAIAPLLAGLEESPGYGEAVAYLAIALPDERTSELATQFAQVPNLDETFSEIAETCYLEDAYDGLRRVLQVGKNLTGHRDLYYYRGILLDHEEKALEAAAAYGKAMDIVGRTDLPDETRKVYLTAYLDAMVELEDPVAGYKRAYDPRLAFHYLVLEISRYGDAAQLQALLVAGKEQAGVGHERLFATGAILAKKDRHAEAAGILSPLRTTLVAQKPQRESEKEALLHEVEDRLVRSLVHSEKVQLAQALAGEIAERDDDWRYVAIVHAKQGNTDKVREALLAAVRAEVDLYWFFEDDDLREVLATDAYKDLRAKHYKQD